MPRKTTSFIPDTSGTNVTPLDQIPADLIQYVEEVYDRQRKTPGRERTEYDTKAEMLAEWKLIGDYVSQRKGKDGKPAILAVRRSPVRDKAENVMEWRITADLPKNGQAKATPAGQ
jgi:hypothetical protein